MVHDTNRRGVSHCVPTRAREASLCTSQGLHLWKQPIRAYQLGLALDCFDTHGQDFEGSQASNCPVFFCFPGPI
jgi:hypothetical protein